MERAGGIAYACLIHGGLYKKTAFREGPRFQSTSAEKSRILSMGAVGTEPEVGRLGFGINYAACSTVLVWFTFFANALMNAVFQRNNVFFFLPPTFIRSKAACLCRRECFFFFKGNTAFDGQLTV